MKKNVTYIISNVDKTVAFEWISTHLDASKFNLNFILLNPGDSELEGFLKKHQIKVDRITYNGKKDILKALFKIYQLLYTCKADIIHTHLFDASLIGLAAGWLFGVKKRVYTRHHSDYHHSYYPHAVKYDKLINYMATDIVAISKVVKDILIQRENVEEKKIRLIHHGFLLQDFVQPPEHTVSRVKELYNPQHQYPVIGMISRYIEWKGIQYSVPAFEKILESYPDALLILANAKGNYTEQVHQMLSRIPKKNYREITFESDIFALYKIFDIFIHVPITSESEAFGQTYVEALAAGVPSVFTRSGIANDFIIHHENAVVVPCKNSDAIFQATRELLLNKALAEKLIVNGRKDVNSKFGLHKMINSLEELYGE